MQRTQNVDADDCIIQGLQANINAHLDAAEDDVDFDRCAEQRGGAPGRTIRSSAEQQGRGARRAAGKLGGLAAAGGGRDRGGCDSGGCGGGSCDSCGGGCCGGGGDDDFGCDDDDPCASEHSWSV